MPDSAFVPRSQQKCQESSKYILLPAKIQNSRYSIRTKPCKYFEIGQCLFGKKCRFFHDPRGPRTFEHEKFSKNLLHEIEKKFEKNHNNLKCILDKQTEEIVSLKKLLIEKLDLLAHKTAENHSLEGKCPSPYDPDNKKTLQHEVPLTKIPEFKNLDLLSNASATNKNDIVEFTNAYKCCGHCGKPAKLRCSQCEAVYYCTSEHQSANWKCHKKFCSLISGDAQNITKEFDIIQDHDADILQLKVKKTKKSLGLLLQFDTQQKVVFINEVVNTSDSVFEVGDQILQINGQNINSVENITHIMGQTDIGNVVEFKIKRPKKELKEH